MDADGGGRARLSHSELLELKRWNTPTIYNGWEQITDRDAAHECFNLEVCRDFMPTSMALSPFLKTTNRVCWKPPGSWIRTNAGR